MSLDELLNENRNESKEKVRIKELSILINYRKQLFYEN